MSTTPKNAWYIAGFAVIVVVAATGLAIINRSAGTKAKPVVSSSVQSNVSVSSDGTIVSYKGFDGSTAMALLKGYTNAQTKSFSGLGEYVVGINGIIAQDGVNYWSFYVNGSAAEVGAGDYQTKSTDTIEWRLENVSSYVQ